MLQYIINNIGNIGYFTIIIVIIGFIIDYIKFRIKDHRERAALEDARYFEAYRDLDERYHNYLELLICNIDANAGIMQNDIDDSQLTDNNRHKRELIYEYILSVMENAFVRKDRSKIAHEKSWPLWDSYIDKYLNRGSFRRYIAKHLIGGGLDMNKSFEDYLRKKIKEMEHH